MANRNGAMGVSVPELDDACCTEVDDDETASDDDGVTGVLPSALLSSAAWAVDGRSEAEVSSERISTRWRRKESSVRYDRKEASLGLVLAAVA